jgi:pteridine reductase
METTGKVALVTGAARRVGRAIALELARAGCDLAVHCRQSTGEARTLADQIRAAGRRATVVVADLAQPDGPEQIVARTIRELGRLDILVNNAAIFEKTPLEQADADTWGRILRINTIAPALLARTAAPFMRLTGAGRIVNLIDVLAERPIKNYGPYCASKAALAALTRSLALELAPVITVNGIAPGIAVFPEDYDQDLRNRLTAKVPLNRPGSPEQIAAVVRFLITDGDYITGQVIAVDGGLSL